MGDRESLKGMEKWTHTKQQSHNITSKNWHERSAFQSVAGQAVDWHDDSEALFSLFFFLFFSLFSVTTFSHRRSARIKKLI